MYSVLSSMQKSVKFVRNGSTNSKHNSKTTKYDVLSIASVFFGGFLCVTIITQLKYYKHVNDVLNYELKLREEINKTWSDHNREINNKRANANP